MRLTSLNKEMGCLTCSMDSKENDCIKAIVWKRQDASIRLYKVEASAS